MKHSHLTSSQRCKSSYSSIKRAWRPRSGHCVGKKTWGASQRVSVDEALRINTLNGAYASREEAIKGSISVGKLADFVVLSEDLHAVDSEKIKDIQIVRTVVGGSTVHKA